MINSKIISRIFFLTALSVSLCANIALAITGDSIVIKNSDKLNVRFFAGDSYIINLSDNIQIKYQDLDFISDSITYFPAESRLSSHTPACISNPGIKLAVNKFDYYLARDKNEILDVRLIFDKWFVTAGRLELYKSGNNKIATYNYLLANVKITSCSDTNPHYFISAKRAKLKTGESLTLYSTVLRIGRVPILYFPYMKKRLDEERFKYEPGYGNKDGFFLLTDYKISNKPPLTTALLTDYYYYRGLGLGLDAAYNTAGLTANLTAYHISEKPLLYDIDGGQYLKIGGSRRDRWKAGLKLKSAKITALGLESRAHINLYSDNLIDKDYKRIGDGLIINDYKNEIEISDRSSNFGWHLIYENKDYWDSGINDFKLDYRRFPELRIYGCRKRIGDYELYYQPSFEFGHKVFGDTGTSSIYLFSNTFLYNRKISDNQKISISAALKTLENEKLTDIVDAKRFQANYAITTNLIRTYKYYYGIIGHSFDKTFLNFDDRLADADNDLFNRSKSINTGSSIAVNKAFLNNYFFFENSRFYLGGAYDFSEKFRFADKKNRFSDIRMNWECDYNSNNHFNIETEYGAVYRRLTLGQFEHTYKFNNKKSYLSNGLNYISYADKSNIYYFNTELLFNLFTAGEHEPSWIFKYGQSFDLDKRYIKSQELLITKDLHCLSGELSYLKTAKNDFTVAIRFNIKAYPKQGLGMQYNYLNKSLRFKQ